MLEDHADRAALPAQRGGVEAGQIDAVDQHPALARPLQQIDQPQQRRLAGAAAPDHAIDRPRRDGEVEWRQRRYCRLAAPAGEGLAGAGEADARGRQRRRGFGGDLGGRPRLGLGRGEAQPVEGGERGGGFRHGCPPLLDKGAALAARGSAARVIGASPKKRPPGTAALRRAASFTRTREFTPQRGSGRKARSQLRCVRKQRVASRFSSHQGGRNHEATSWRFSWGDAAQAALKSRGSDDGDQPMAGKMWPAAPRCNSTYPCRREQIL